MMLKNFLIVGLLLTTNFCLSQDTGKNEKIISVMSTVYFETDSDQFYHDSRQTIEDLFLFKNGSVVKQIILTGFCDERGSNSYNKDLALRRVKNVQDFFNSKGNFDPSIFEIHVRGELNPGDLEYFEGDYQLNRRVQINVSYEYPDSTLLNRNRDSEVIAVESQEKSLQKISSKITDSLKLNDKLVFNNVIFYPGTHRLREISYPVMDSIINSLMIHKKYEIEIQGHICCNGLNEPGLDKDTGQWNLSTARAEQIKRFFVKYGLDPTRFTTIGKMANFKTGKSDFYDRRVELHITAIRENETEKE
ncbi:OmpA family protein [Nonlabens sp. Asnod3-A02]|uniref:OmpA family protein n=1 Tax=Nonlabens sp. Asnod3-A02 TaxID=3160579 RepID=UPI00386BA4D3